MSLFRLIDCGPLPVNSDYILISIYGYGLKLRPYSTNNYVASDLITANVLTLGTWAHIATTTDSLIFKFYFNGVLDSQQSGWVEPRNVSRTNCYLGRSNWGEPNIYSFYDDVMFFNRALTSDEVKLVMTSYFTNDYQVTIYKYIIVVLSFWYTDKKNLEVEIKRKIF